MVKNIEDKINEYRIALRQAESALVVTLEQSRVDKKIANLRLKELSHEIKNPLNSILGFSEMLMSEILGEHSNPKYKDYAANIHEAAEYLLKICNNELNISSAKNITDVNISDVFDKTLTQLEMLSDDLGVDIEVNISDDFPIIKVDPVRLQQVIFNLVSNAIKFTPDGGKVEVKAKVDAVDGAVILVIQDNGFGMSPEDLIEFIKPFNKSDYHIDNNKDGSGLGLAIVTRLTEEMGIGFEIRSQEKIGTVATLKINIKNTDNDNNA